jgi:hypothetical protein
MLPDMLLDLGPIDRINPAIAGWAGGAGAGRPDSAAAAFTRAVHSAT